MASQPPQHPGGWGKTAGGRGSGRGSQAQFNKGRGPESHPLPNGTPSPPPEPVAPGGGMSWAARVASAKPTPAAPNGTAADGPAAPPASASAPAAPAIAVPAAAPVAVPTPASQPTTAGVKLPPGVEGRQPSIKFGDIDPIEVVKEQQPSAARAAPVPAVAKPAQAAPAPAPAAPTAPAVPARPTPVLAPQQPVSAAPLPVMPASTAAPPQRPGGYAAVAAGSGGPKPTSTAVPVMMPPQSMPQQMQHQAAAARQQHGGGPRGGQGRGPAGQQQQPGAGINHMVYPQQFSMNPAFSMNPGAATFGPNMSGVMFMPGGNNYFAPNYSQAWQGGQYGQYVNPAAMQSGAGGQQGIATSGGMAPQQQQPTSTPYAAPSAGAHKATPMATPPREKKILRLENPDTHEVIDLSKPMASGQQAGSSAAKAAEKKAPAVPAAKPEPASLAAAPAAADEKPEPAAGPATPAADAAKGPEPAKAAEVAGKPGHTQKEVAAPAPAAPAASAPVPAASVTSAAAPAVAALSSASALDAVPGAPKPAGAWGSNGQSFKEVVMVDKSAGEKKRQEDEAARKKAAEDEAAHKAAEDAKRKADEEKKAAEEDAHKMAEEEQVAHKAAAESKRKIEEEAAAKQKAEEEAAAAAKQAAAREAAAKEAAAKEAAAKEAAAKEAAVAEKKADEDAAAAAAKSKVEEQQPAPAEAEAASAEPATEGNGSLPAAEPVEQQDKAAALPASVEVPQRAAQISPFSSSTVEEGELPSEEQQQAEEDAEPPTGFEHDKSGRKRYGRDFLFYYGNKCTAVPKGIEAETFKQLSRENMPPGPPMMGMASRGPRGGGGGGFGGDERWQSGRMPSGPVPGPPGMRGDPRMMGRQQSGRHRGGVEADQWERGKPLPPMPNMQQYDGRRGGPPPGMRMPSGPVPHLHKTESAYKVGATLTDDPAEEQAQKRLKSLLNKITKDNFAKITAQIVEVINERKLAKTLSGFINQIFDKALTEPHFAELYADLVAALNPELPKLKDEEGNDVQFRRTLLNKCQEEFEAGATAMKAVSEREKLARESGAAPLQEGQEEEKEEEEEEEKEEAAAEEGEVKDEARAKHDAEVAAKKAELAARKEERKKAMAELQARKRMLGNIVFVGQLFKKGVLTETVMHTCIKQLLEEVENPKPEDVECMCKLLSTVGGLLDSSTKPVKGGAPNAKQVSTKEVMNVYFNRIETLARNEALDSRHRFMLMDLIDQRRNRWRLRKEAEGPKTIEEIHREEALKRSRSAMLDRQQSSRGDSFRGGPRGGAPPGRPPFDNRVDAPIRAMNRVGSNDFMGPGGQQSLRPGGRPGPQRGADRPGSAAGPPERQPSARQPGPPAPPARGERAPEPAAASTAEPPAAPERAAPAAGELSADQVQSKVKALLAELYNANDLKEGLICVKELVDQSADTALLFEVMLTTSLESKGTNWEALAALFSSCVQEGVLQSADLERGARQLLDNLDDLSVDVPKAPLQVGVVLGELVAVGGCDLKVLAEHIRTADANPDEIQEGEDTMLVGGGGAAKTVASLLQKLAELKGEEAARQAWQATGEQLAAFLPQPDRDDTAQVKALAEKFGLLSIACAEEA